MEYGCNIADVDPKIRSFLVPESFDVKGAALPPFPPLPPDLPVAAPSSGGSGWIFGGLVLAAAVAIGAGVYIYMRLQQPPPIPAAQPLMAAPQPPAVQLQAPDDLLGDEVE